MIELVLAVSGLVVARERLPLALLGDEKALGEWLAAIARSAGIEPERRPS